MLDNLRAEIRYHIYDVVQREARFEKLRLRTRVGPHQIKMGLEISLTLKNGSKFDKKYEGSSWFIAPLALRLREVFKKRTNLTYIRVEAYVV